MKTLDTLKTFVVLEELAHGGMGAVHVGYNPAARRLVAIKTLFKETGKDKTSVERFRYEGEIYRRLSHPNIVGFVDMGEVDGVNFIALEHVKGRPLDSILKERGAMPWKEAIKIAGALADAMAHYHDRSLIHRDVKPQNVLVSPDGVVKLIDFGIAISREEASQPDGSIVGTFNYSSPEQNQGRKLDERSDLYALGLILHELVTGKRVFPQTSLTEVSSGQLKADIPYPSAVESEVPKGLDKIAMKLLSRDPNARYQKANELVADFELLKEDPDGFDPKSAFDDEGISAKWEQAKAALLKKDYEQALRLGQVVASRKSDSAEIHALLGKAQAGAGLGEDAIVSFQRALELEPEIDQHRLDFGIALYGLKRFDEAEEQFQNILDLVPDNPYAKRYLGLCAQAKQAAAAQPPPPPPQADGTPTSPTAAAQKTVDRSAERDVIRTIPIPPPPTVAKQASAGSKKAYLWWGLGALGAGRPIAAGLLSVLELAVIGLAVLPWTPAWPPLVQPPTGPLAALFAPDGPLAAASAFKEWTVAGPALGLFIILEAVLPARLSAGATAGPR